MERLEASEWCSFVGGFSESEKVEHEVEDPALLVHGAVDRLVHGAPPFVWLCASEPDRIGSRRAERAADARRQKRVGQTMAIGPGMVALR